MGTSQSFKLKKSPNWSKAKRAMTTLANETGDVNTNCGIFMHAFNNALGSDLYRGSAAQRGGNTFGRAGSRIASNFINFIAEVRNNGLNATISPFLDGQELQNLSPKDILLYLFSHLAGKDKANMDDDAAKYAMKDILAEMFQNSENAEDIEDILKHADQDQLDQWLIDFQVIYIVEFNAQLFQSHILEKEKEPQTISDEIKRFLESEIQHNLSEEMHHIDLFSDEGKTFIKKMTHKILEIWQ